MLTILYLCGFIKRVIIYKSKNSYKSALQHSPVVTVLKSKRLESRKGERKGL
jgi:hypothetical protein